MLKEKSDPIKESKDMLDCYFTVGIMNELSKQGLVECNIKPTNENDFEEMKKYHRISQCDFANNLMEITEDKENDESCIQAGRIGEIAKEIMPEVFIHDDC